MPAAIKSNLKSWMLVYVGFIVAISTTNSDIGSKSAAQLVSPGAIPTGSTIEQTYFRPTVAEPRRNDI